MSETPESSISEMGIPQLDVRSLLVRHGVTAKKSWSQNFLLDERAYQSIVRACKLSPQDTAIEIGAGLGTLTSRLLQTGATVIAVERERDMCQVLRSELGQVPSVRLLEQDALTLDVAQLRGQDGLVARSDRPWVVVGNLPYQITTPLIFHLLAQRTHLRAMIFMVQREVADRILAAPDSEHYGALSAQLQLLARPELVCQVRRGAFLPAPRVDSTVIRLLPHAPTAVPVRSTVVYASVVRAAFSQRRKTLRNALSTAFDAADLARCAQTGLDLSRRAETLSIAEFACLADALDLR